MARFEIVACRRAVTDGRAQEFRKIIEAQNREDAETEARAVIDRVYSEMLELAPRAPRAWLQSAKLELVSVTEVA